MKKVVITGVAGFLGSQLAKRLVADHTQVIGIDNLSSGKVTNVAGIMDHPMFTFLLCDVADPSIIQRPELRAADEIYHLASPASPKFYQAAPLATIAVNTAGTQNMLTLAQKWKSRVVYTSTSEAYGDPEEHPQAETYRGNVNTWGPRACYDESKRLGEVLCYEYYQQHRVKVTVVRLFNTYSAALRNDDGRVISNFVTQALLGEDLTVYGDGSQTRSFCYADDTLRALQLAMAADQAIGEIINIGNPKEYTVLELAEMVRRLTGTTSGIAFHELPPDDPKVRRPVIGKAAQLLGWAPNISLEEGLRLTIEAYQKSLQIPPATLRQEAL